MNHEIERRFLVSSDAWRSLPSQSEHFLQAYLSARSDVMTVRIRIADTRAWLTLKWPSAHGAIARDEYEREIPREHAETLLQTHARSGVIDKTRYTLILPDAHRCFVDCFSDVLDGLCIAEIEFESEEAAQRYVMPSAYFDREITGDHRYSNLALAYDGRPVTAAPLSEP